MTNLSTNPQPQYYKGDINDLIKESAIKYDKKKVMNEMVEIIRKNEKLVKKYNKQK